MATQIEMLAAILASSRRRPIFALVTETYVMIESDSTPVNISMNVPIDGTGAYSDSQETSFSDFFMEVIDVVITQDQAPDVLLSNMTTGTCDVTILTITEVTQDQAPDTLLSNMTTGVCDVTILTITEIEQDQAPDTLLSNMTTGICSVIIT
jgi:hypothetical protein